MRILRIALHGLVLAITTIMAILVGFGVYGLLRPVNQMAMQVPVAAMVCIIAFVSWRFFTQRLPFKEFAWPSSGELAWMYLTALLWSPVIFIPFHYITQGYLTSLGNILGIWLFQIPVNFLAILAAHKLRDIWLIVLLFLAACTVQPQPAPTSPAEMVTVPAGGFLMGQDEGSRSNRLQHSVYLNAFAIDRTEVTNVAFAEFIAKTGYQAAGWNEKLLEAQDQAQTFFRDSSHSARPNLRVGFRCAQTLAEEANCY